MSVFGAPGISAKVDRNTVQVGETVNFTLTFEDLAPAGAPALPAIPNMTASSAADSSTEIRFINGQQTTRHSYTYSLKANKEGEIIIPSIQATTQGRVYSTQPIRMQIVKASAAANGDATVGKLAFLQMQLPKSEIFEGEALPVDILLYTLAYRDPQRPQIEAEGLTVGNVVNGGLSQTMREGQMYNVLTLKARVTSLRAGQARLGPVTILVPIPTNVRRTFFGDMYDWRQVTLTAPAQLINVLPLPKENVPPDFNGIIGNYSMHVTAGPTNLAVGDPITLKVQIRGNGPLEGLNLPSQAHWRDFKTYPATFKFEPRDALGLSGTKSFEQVVIPENHEITALPSFRFTFFDTAQKSYRTITSPAIPLTVRATASAALPVLTNAAAGKNNPPPVDDIVHIRPRLESVAVASPPLLQRPWFLAWQAIPLLAWIGLMAIRLRNEALAKNPRLQRQRQVALRVKEGLKELRVQAEKREAEQFFATFFRLLQEQVGERLDLPASAITAAVIDERLRGRKLDENTLIALHGLFQICDHFRYAPVKKTSQELVSLIPRLENVLQTLQKWEGVP